MLLSLRDIKAAIANAPALVLNEETLGSDCSRVLKKSFHPSGDIVLNVERILEESNDHVVVSGTCAQLVPWDSGNVIVTLLDHLHAGGERERHCLLCTKIPEASSVYSWLGQFSEEAAVGKLHDYIETLSFSGTAMVFSSADYTRARPENIFYPDVLRAVMPSSQVGFGMNFAAQVTFFDALDAYCEQLLGGAPLEKNKAECVIYPDEDSVWFSLRRSLSIDRRIEAFDLQFEGASIAFPLSREGAREPRIRFDGLVNIGSARFDMRADCNTYYQTLAISFAGFPSLEQIVGLLGDEFRSTYFGEPFSSLLSVTLSRLGFVVSLTDQSLHEISCSLTTEKEISLVEKIISFRPVLDVRICSPFDAESRSVEGKLEGDWRLGSAAVTTALYYPSFDFVAGLKSDQSLELSEVVKSVFGSINLPKPKIDARVTGMEVWGNFANKSFSAEIESVFEWQFALGGRPFGLRISKLLMTYAGKQVSCTLDGAMQLAGVDVFILAEYDRDVGWVLSGGTPAREVVNFTSIAHDLLESLSLDAKLPELKLTNIIFSAAPKKGDYSLSCEAGEDWELMPGLSLKVDQFKAEKRQGLSVTGLLRVKMTIAGAILWLSAEKAAAATGGWKFQGRSAEGEKMQIGKIVEWVASRFGEARLPEAIEGFTVDKLQVSFESESKDFFFTCEGEVTLPGQKTAIAGVITIDIKNQDKSYTKLFGGSLTIDGMEFDLVFFESSHNAVGGGSNSNVEHVTRTTATQTRMVVAAYHDANGHTVKIDDLIKRVLATPAATGLEISIKDAVFAYQKTDKSTKYLFGLDIEGGLNLSELNLPNLPLIGQPFPAGQTLKLALQVLAAGDNAFTTEEISDLNRLNGKGTRLPQQDVKGLKLAALLRVGEETKPLNLPIGLSSSGNGLVEEKAAVPATTAPDQRTQAASADGTQWIKIQKTFGPIHVERVGIGYQSGNIALLLDSALTVAGLTLSLDGLGAEFALKDLAAKQFKPTFHLNGLGIDYRNGPLEIGGSFLAQKGTLTVGGKTIDYANYAGLAVIRTAKLTLSAIGSYAQLNDRDPSLFVYAVANYPLGGPAFFYVTGFAAGFGYNRALTLPPIEAIASFPLVTEAVKDGGPANLPTSEKEQQKTLTEKLQQLEEYLPPSVGDIFVAAGIKFTSFKQIDSFALLVIQFGRRFEIDLLGLSTLTAPPPETGKGVTPLAEAQLALKASFVPDEGFLGVRAQLTSSSYILSKDCHLSGGFAFYTWFEPHRQAGDFVLTLGGYHPKFIVPDHYPRVPRLALNWQVSSELHLKADAYFALTNSCIMAGAHLEATWQSGALRAWFNAGADFILAWKPYHYDVAVYVSMGVSYTFEFFGKRTVTADLGADLRLWGPEFSGTATIHWSIISFTVNFGQGAPQELEKIDWKTFKTSFLPKSEQICSTAVRQGLIRQLKDTKQKPPQNHPQAEGKSERWIVNPKEMVLAVSTAIPLNRAGALATHMQLTERDIEEKTKHLAIAPMGIESNLTSTCDVSIVRDDGRPLERDTFAVRPIWKPMPAGLWGKPNLSDDKRHLRPPSLNGAQLVENTLTGFEVRPIEKNQQAETCDIERERLQYTTELIEDAYGWRDCKVSAPRGQDAWDKAVKTVAAKREEREKLAKALGLVSPAIDFGEPIDQGAYL